MRKLRFPIAGLMLIVLVAALGLARCAMRRRRGQASRF